MFVGDYERLACLVPWPSHFNRQWLLHIALGCGLK